MIYVQLNFYNFKFFINILVYYLHLLRVIEEVGFTNILPKPFINIYFDYFKQLFLNKLKVINII